MKLENIENHEFSQILLSDSIDISSGREINIFDIELENANFNEYEYYIHNTGFYYFHLIQLCHQLKNAVELLSNFSYNNKNKVTRDLHLTYNVENYIIRLSSINDRLLQLVNAVFHLCIDEKLVSERNVSTNLKISRTEFKNIYKEFKNSNNKYINERNTIIHKHSFLEIKLRKIHVLYGSNFLDRNNIDKDSMKFIKKDFLTKYIRDTKSEFTEINNECFSKLLPIFDFLLNEYNKMKEKLK